MGKISICIEPWAHFPRRLCRLHPASRCLPFLRSAFSQFSFHISHVFFLFPALYLFPRQRLRRNSAMISIKSTSLFPLNFFSTPLKNLPHQNTNHYSYQTNNHTHTQSKTHHHEDHHTKVRRIWQLRRAEVRSRNLRRAEGPRNRKLRRAERRRVWILRRAEGRRIWQLHCSTSLGFRLYLSLRDLS